MSTQTSLMQKFTFASDHLEQLSRGISALTVDPYKNALYYFFPIIGTFFAGYHQLRVDSSLEATMPSRDTSLLIQEIDQLRALAGIGRKVIPYTAFNHVFSHFGGTYSIVHPVLLIPEQHLFRKNGNRPFPQEPVNATLWTFSNDETRFLIARELGQIKTNSVLLKIAIKVALLAAVFAIYTSPLGLPAGIALYTVASVLYILSERFFQAKADIIGTQILGKMNANPLKIAIDTLEKMRRQNIYRRENSKLARWHITKSGNNLLNFLDPFLTTRIERLRIYTRST